MRATMTIILALLGAGAAVAQDATGAPVAGEEQFQRRCIACHVVQDRAGEVLAGRNARVGPNLYGVVGRVAGGLDDYDYSALMETYGATGTVWEEENLVAYLEDPTGHLREATGETSGRSKMAYQVPDEQEAHDLVAYLAIVSPQDDTSEGDAGEGDPGEATSE